MSEKTIIVRKKKLIYVLKPDSIIVFVGFGQWISYNQYNNWNRQGLAQFKQIILKSKESEYDSAPDQMSLAYECNIKGVGTQKPKDVEL